MVKKPHNHYKDYKRHTRKKVYYIVTYDYQAVEFPAMHKGCGHMEIWIYDNVKLSANMLQKHVEETHEQQNKVKVTAVILGLNKL